MKTRVLHLILTAVIFSLVGYFVGVNKIALDWKNYKPQFSVISKEPPAHFDNVDFSLFWKTWQKLEESYYDKQVLDPNKLVEGAISGMVESLGDPYTVYLPPPQNATFKEGLAGAQFEGIGAELGMRDKQIIVVAPLDGMPAKAAGIKPGDAILKVDDNPTAGWTLAEAVENIRGTKGTKVVLNVLHKDDGEPVDITIVRDTIVVKSVFGWVKKIGEIENINSQAQNKDKYIAYIRVSQFGDKTNDEWLATVNAISLALTNKKIEGVIVDLRNNPGGYLHDATFVASEFIKSGTVVMEEKANGERKNLTVSRNGILTDLPLVVLINKGSASASEIVAGALADRKGAKLVGETSFGKGTIQQAEDLGGGAGLHITISKWLTPNGTWVHKDGLKPDIEVALSEDDEGHDIQLERAVEELAK